MAKFKKKYSDLQDEEFQNSTELKDWQKKILDKRLNDYYINTKDVMSFDDTIANIRKKHKLQFSK